MRSLVISIFLCACETRTITAEFERKIQVQKWDAFEDFWACPTQRSCFEWRGGEQYQACFWAVWRSYHHCEKTQIEIVRAHNKINRTCKDDPTRHGTRREKERQTEKELGRQHIAMARIRIGWSWGQRGMERSGCPITLDALTVI